VLGPDQGPGVIGSADEAAVQATVAERLIEPQTGPIDVSSPS
jgi:hypothetical protein